MSATNRVRAMVLLLGCCCVPLTGCSNPARDRMIGRWEASTELTEEDTAALMPTDNPIAAALGKVLLQKARAETQWEFAADDSVTAAVTWLGNAKTQTGSWRFLGGDSASTRLEIAFENHEPFEVNLAFSGRDNFEAASIVMHDVQLNRPIKFKRVITTP